ncbi:MAG: alpha/beta hydrolase [Bacteroidota bacterium]
MKWFLTILMVVFCSEAFSQERYVSIDGQKFRIKTAGAGATTVIFECGLADSLEVWDFLPDSVARFAKVFLYDRADIGKSDFSRQERTLPNLADELQHVLKAAEIRPPYVVVGHSFGGSIARYFADQYPDQVTGLLLLDPLAEAYYQHLSKKELKEYLQFVQQIQNSREPRYRKEEDQTFNNLAYLKDLHIRQDLPIIMISVVHENGDDYPKYKEEILSGFNHARQIIVEGTHYVHRDYPKLVIRSIKELIE